jgi:hypothetical protein
VALQEPRDLLEQAVLLDQLALLMNIAKYFMLILMDPIVHQMLITSDQIQHMHLNLVILLNLGEQ